MDDGDKFVDRGSGCIGRVNEAEDFSVELFAVDVAADSDEWGVGIGWMSDMRREECPMCKQWMNGHRPESGRGSVWVRVVVVVVGKQLHVMAEVQQKWDRPRRRCLMLWWRRRLHWTSLLSVSWYSSGGHLSPLSRLTPGQLRRCSYQGVLGTQRWCDEVEWSPNSPLATQWRWLQGESFWGIWWCRWRRLRWVWEGSLEECELRARGRAGCNHLVDSFCIGRLTNMASV